MTIAFLDVHYHAAGARAACVVADTWGADTPTSLHVSDIEAVESYVPGHFYRRELPCLLSVLRLLPKLPDIIVIDGYVWLSPTGRPGLGAHLHEALGGQRPIVGIAKTAFAGAETSAAVVPVLRGSSRKPLFVTAAGMPPEVAAQCVRRMAGAHRTPELVRLADRLARSGLSGNHNPQDESHRS